VDALDLDQRQLAEAMGFGASAAFRAALEAPERLERRQLARLAVLLGVDSRAVYAAASASAPQRDADADAPHGDAAPSGDAARGEDHSAADRARDGDATAGEPTAPAPEAPTHAPTQSPARSPAEEPSAAELPVADTLAATLERTVAAVDDDPLGRRVRLAILATVQTAAAEAGRTVPPELYDVRRRVQAGQLPWVGEGAIVLEERGAGADDAVLAAAAALVRDVQATASGYADLFAPVHDDALGELLRRLTVSVRAAALGPTSACVVTPPLYGRYLLVCSADATADQRRLALRRGLAHVMAGHVGALAPLPLPAPPAAERLADLAALADLVPFWQIEDLRRQGRLGWRAVTDAVARTTRALAGDWADERAQDRAVLRIRLYRAYRI
jgi:hypothetical protein